MISKMNNFLTKWNATQTGDPIETHSSTVIPIKYQGKDAMLKVYKGGSDEQNSAKILKYWDGNSAVELYAADG